MNTVYSTGRALFRAVGFGNQNQIFQEEILDYLNRRKIA